ncbi:MAG TPA: IS21 family transposase [Actinomycetota bacterium]|nr:IS21 family transposase [Actinomycetota bacterium]
MAKRSKVELFEQIRKAHDRDDLSIHGLARRFHVHRRTVREALASPIPPPRKTGPPRPAPALGPWKETIDGWLEADREVPRKQRHTARRIWQRLVEEHDASVSETSVRRYVRLAKGRKAIPAADVMIPQTHPLGYESEVDFGRVSFYLAGELTEGFMFVMRLSASGRGFHHVYANEAQEAFFDGHVLAFEHFGGAPARVRYDNLRPAVAKVLLGRNRQETDRFAALRSHYLFDSFYCRPGQEGAHEKGGVEGEVGRFRRRHLVPMPRVSSFAELNLLCAEGDRLDDVRRIDGRRMTVVEHFALERPLLHPLPAEPFGVGLDLKCRVDTKSRVCVRQCFYSVPVRYAGMRICVRLGAETVEALDGSRVVASHPRAVGKGAESLELDHYLETLQCKLGALTGSTALHQARASGRFTAAHDRFFDLARRRLGDKEGTKALIGVLLGHRTLPFEAMVTGIWRALAVGSVDPDVVLVEARRATERPSAVPIAGVGRFDRPKPSLDGYDDLLKESG